MKGHSEEEFSIEPEVGVVIAKTTMQHIRLILHKYQFIRQQKALTVICTILLHTLIKLKKTTIYSSSQVHSGPPINNKTQKNKNTWNYGSNSVGKFILKARFGMIQWLPQL